MWTAFGIAMFVIFVLPWFDKELIGALMEFAGVPANIVEIVVRP